MRVDIDRAWEALQYAQRARIHVLGCGSDIHLEYKLRTTREQMIRDSIEAVKYARTLCNDVEFSPEDATRADVDFLCQLLDAVTEEIYKTSRLLGSITGIHIQPNKAIMGDNAFAHEAGIHQHGVLSNPITYKIMTPQSIGLPRNRIVLGKHSGRYAFAKRLEDLGYELTKEALNRAFARFKDLADKKKELFDGTDVIEAGARAYLKAVNKVALQSKNGAQY